jgi:hypothetical protein
MGDPYVPIDPQRKLQEFAVMWVSTMQKFHREPNCKVAFGGESQTSPEPAAAGWVLDSSEAPGKRDRYLLLPDGGVWHELLLEPPLVAESSVEVREWVSKPSDELVSLLGRCVTRVQYGFADERIDTPKADPVVVDDRRRVWRAHPGTERRGQG